MHSTGLGFSIAGLFFVRVFVGMFFEAILENPRKRCGSLSKSRAMINRANLNFMSARGFPIDSLHLMRSKKAHAIIFIQRPKAGPAYRRAS